MKENNNQYVLSTRQKVYLPFKRIFDILFSFLFILILSPLFIILSICVLIDTHGFPIFRQRRIGRNNKEFIMVKFRSMNVKAPRDTPTHLLIDPFQYMSKFGRFIRRTSLDELPQLFNIFIGNMSFIGPRPALWCQDDLIEERNKNNVQILRPGLSGYAQTHGRDELEIPKKVEFDTYYLKNIGIWLDIKILFISIGKALTGENVSEGSNENK